MGERSGVKLSGPQKNFFTPTSRVRGTRLIAVSRKGAIRSQSGSISPKEKSDGIPATFQAAACGSNKPTMRPPPSGRM